MGLISGGGGKDATAKAGFFRSTGLACLLAVLTFITFFPALRGEFLDWDDDTHVYENIQVYSLAPDGLRRIFTGTVNDTYIPLTTLSFALEWHFFQDDPFVYKLNNLLLHILVCLLIFAFARKLGFEPRSAFFAGLFFAAHPMHVESVAWITERKDVLYAFFYLLSLIAYTSWVQDGKKRMYALSCMAAVLSLLAKPMALSLPLILLVYDGFLGRGINRKRIAEKIPFFVIAVGIAFITFRMNTPEPGTAGAGQGVLIWIWSLVFYPLKFFFPFQLNPLYRLPLPVSIWNPAYAGALAAAVFLGLLLIRFRRERLVVLAYAHYFFSIFFLLRFNYTDLNVVADRFMYLPSLGICLLLGAGLHRFLSAPRKGRAAKGFPVVLAGGIFAVLMLRTWGQIQIWENRLAFWNYDIQAAPVPDPLPYTQRGNFFAHSGDYRRALADYETALRIEDTYARAYYNQGLIYDQLGRHDAAVERYTRAISADPEYAMAYNNRGYNFLHEGNVDKARSDFQRAVTLNPDLAEAWNNLGKLHFETREFPLALNCFTEAIRVDPYFATAYVNRGVIMALAKKFDEALRDLNTAARLDPEDPMVYVNRARVYQESGQADRATADLDKANALSEPE